MWIKGIVLSSNIFLSPKIISYEILMMQLIMKHESPSG